jgi:hypothetical protein
MQPTASAHAPVQPAAAPPPDDVHLLPIRRAEAASAVPPRRGWTPERGYPPYSRVSSRFKILPAGDNGNESTNTTERGNLYFAS